MFENVRSVMGNKGLDSAFNENIHPNLIGSGSGILATAVHGFTGKSDFGMGLVS